MTETQPVLLFYKYVVIDDPAGFACRQRQLCTGLGLKGRVLIASEGINGTLSGDEASVQGYIAALSSDARFADVEFKVSTGDAHTFPKLVVKVRAEIVTLGASVPLTPDRENHLTPEQWKRALEVESEPIVLDVRNRYESAAGRFAGAIACDIGHFRELPGYVDSLADFKHRKVLMYCTGGIRCEKASALFRSKGFTDVSQLHGGIAAYQKEFGNEHWLGELFVFDQRMTVRVDEALVPLARCAHSGRSTNRFVNCLHDPCHVLFLLAEETEKENAETRLCPACRVTGWTVATADYKGSPARAPKQGISAIN